jgi:hypothetical protein
MCSMEPGRTYAQHSNPHTAFIADGVRTLCRQRNANADYVLVLALQVQPPRCLLIMLLKSRKFLVFAIVVRRVR